MSYQKVNNKCNLTWSDLLLTTELNFNLTVLVIAVTWYWNIEMKLYKHITESISFSTRNTPSSCRDVARILSFGNELQWVGLSVGLLVEIFDNVWHQGFVSYLDIRKLIGSMYIGYEFDISSIWQIDKLRSLEGRQSVPKVYSAVYTTLQ